MLAGLSPSSKNINTLPLKAENSKFDISQY